MSGLRIAAGLELPVDVAGEAIAILAKRGAGKTNTGRVLVEELQSAHVQTVVLDPVGAWWGLRGAADGKAAGLSIPVLGGAHQDVPLEPTAGKLVADVVVDSGQSLVIDLSDFSKTQQRQFVVDFAERLYTRKARQSSLMHVVLEEADEFAPQRVSAGDARMVGAIEQLVRRGRGRGIGITMITQRSAALNKGVLEQSDVLIVMRTTGPRDRAAIAAWVEKQDVDGADDVLPSLAGLETGEAWIWNPERAVLERVRIRLAWTFDSGATPKAGRKATKLELAPIDLTALGEQIAATAERAKDNDPAELRKRIREVNAKLAELNAKLTATTLALAERPTLEQGRELQREIDRLTVELEQRPSEPVRVSAITRQHLLPIQARLMEARAAAEDGLRELATLAEELDTFPTRQEASNAEIRPDAPARPVREVPPVRHDPARRQPTPAPPGRPDAVPGGASGRGNDASVSGPQQRILNALAALETIGVAAPAKVQVALFAEASPKSSTYTNNLGALRSAGLIDYPVGGRVQLTDAGRQAADAAAAPQTVDQMHLHVRSLVGGTKWRLLEQLIPIYPNALSKTELAERAGASASSSTYTNNLGSLRSLGLIDYPQGGYVAALPVLFMEGA